MRRLLPAFLSLSLLAAPGQAIVRRDDVADSAYVTLGAASQFAPVGKFGGTCSGTLITSQWVLTAAHCVGIPGLPLTTFRVGNQNYPVASVNPFRVHPDWSGDLLAGNDIALVKLATPVVGITPADLYAGSGEVGALGYYSGYGFKGTGLTGHNAADGGHRTATNVIDGYGDDIFPELDSRVLVSDFDSPTGDANTLAIVGSSPVATAMEGSIAPADSGGGLFLNVGGFWRLAGVHSFIAALDPPDGDGTPNAEYGELMGSTRVAAHIDWVRLQAGMAPEPGTLALLGMGLVGLRRLRHRK